jgi:hypothetical protein
MLKSIPGPVKDYSRPTLWAGLITYLLGYAVFGFLLAMPSPALPTVAFTGVVVGVMLLSLAGSLAPDRSRRGSFILSVLGALPLIGVIAWAGSIAGAKAFSIAVFSVVFWGSTWAIAETQDIAGPIALVFGWVAIVSWAANAAAFLAGVLFMFVSSGCAALGERLGDRWDSRARFLVLTSTAGLGLTLGWLGHRVF